MTPQLILAVEAGGALGSVARYLVGIGSAKAVRKQTSEYFDKRISNTSFRFC